MDLKTNPVFNDQIYMVTGIKEDVQNAEIAIREKLNKYKCQSQDLPYLKNFDKFLKKKSKVANKYEVFIRSAKK